MKSLLFLLLMISFSVKGESISIYSPAKSLPLELKYLIESIQLSDLKRYEQNNFKANLQKLDQMVEKFSTEELFFVIKSEAYKSILKVKPDYMVKKSYYDVNIIDNLDHYSKSKTISSFSKWVANSIQKDLKDVFLSSDYTTYMYRKKNNSILTPRYLKVDKKLKILLPWYAYLHLTPPNEFDVEMRKVMILLFDKVVIYLEQLLSFSRFEKFELNPLRKEFKYFSLRKFNPESKEALAPTQEQASPLNNLVQEEVKPETKKEDDSTVSRTQEIEKANEWMPKEDVADQDVKVDPTPIPTPDPNYKAPEKLPEPVNDWLDELTE